MSMNTLFVAEVPFPLVGVEGLLSSLPLTLASSSFGLFSFWLLDVRVLTGNWIDGGLSGIEVEEDVDTAAVVSDRGGAIISVKV